MQETFKTAAKIWMSAIRFAIRSPWLLFVGFSLFFVIDYALDVIDDINYSTFFEPGVGFILLVAAILVPLALMVSTFHVYGMRYAMRFATGKAEAWSLGKWCRRSLDCLWGIAAYMGLSFTLIPIVMAMFSRLEHNASEPAQTIWFDDDPSGIIDLEYWATILAFGLLALAVIYIITRVSLWIPLAAFRRDGEWSCVLAWNLSKSKGLLLISTLVLFEVVGGAVIFAAVELDGFKESLRDALLISQVVGWSALREELSFILELADRLMLPFISCIVIAIRTSVAANLLGIREQDGEAAYFTYKTRSLPHPSPHST